MKTRKTLMRRALDKVKNNKSYVISATVVAACTAAVLFRQCGEPQAEGPRTVDVQRADGICDAAYESSPYLLDANRNPVLDGQGNKVENPYYSKEDCHDRDGVCDSDADNLVDPAGNPVELVAADAFGRPYTFTPESADPEDPGFSMDCIRVQCGHQCGENGDELCPVIEDRPLITGDTKISDNETAELYWGQMTESERQELWISVEQGEEMDASPVRSGFWKARSYGEVCPSKRTKELPECGPLTEGPCVCENHSRCEPRPRREDVCGDGNITGNEECDPESRRARDGCSPGHTCTDSCTCRPVRRENPCGNGKIDSGEQCDPRSSRARGGCEEGHSCTSRCTCREDRPPQPVKRELEKCPAAVTGSGQAKMVRREAFNRVVAKGRHIQEALGAAGRAVLVTVSTVVDSRGRVRQKSVTA
ncbi:hypothetical protein GF318_02285, partial [Candidatus Micrarchaeota archaeon]|nr:hypothetical protein [Candidatus Micrarchaeota archaeon]